MSSFAKLVVVVEMLLASVVGYKQNCVQLSLLYLPCYETMGLPSSFMFYARADIVIRFFDTDLYVLIRLSVIEV